MTCCTSNMQGKVIFLSAKTLCLNLCVSLCLLFSALAFLMGVPDWLMFSFESLIGWCCVQHYCYRWSQQFQVLAFFSKFPLINQDPRDYDQTINTFTLIQFWATVSAQYQKYWIILVRVISLLRVNWSDFECFQFFWQWRQFPEFWLMLLLLLRKK